MIKVLQICSKPPWPPVDGGCLAALNIGKGLAAEGHQVKVLTISTPKHPFLYNEMPENYRNTFQPEHEYINTDIRPARALANLLFSSLPYNVERFMAFSFEERIRETLQQEAFDMVQLEGLFVAPYLDTVKSYTDAPVVMRAHNIEHRIWAGRTLQAKGLKKWYFNKLTQRLKSYEQKVLNHNELDAIAAISATDEAWIKTHCQTPVQEVPFGIEVPEAAAPPNAQVYFLGAFDWQPNLEGIQWFLKEVWPKVTNAVPDAAFHLAGRGMPEELRHHQQQGVTIHGAVDDANTFIDQHGILVVPLFTGSGVRIKIIEALARGKAIVTTTTGAAGLHFTANEDLIIEDEAARFAQQLIQLLNNEPQRHALGAAAHRLANERYSIQGTTQQLISCYRQLLNR